MTVTVTTLLLLGGRDWSRASGEAKSRFFQGRRLNCPKHPHASICTDHCLGAWTSSSTVGLNVVTNLHGTPWVQVRGFACKINSGTSPRRRLGSSPGHPRGT